MCIEALQNIIITDDDINWAEAIIGNITFDECRRNIIKNLDSIDIQAFPGTGKTTVLVAKLAILAQKWSYANKGICVLSHTNVAREEIQERLGQTDAGRKLLSYPHFIGTLHSFFDTFISMPWIQSKGIRVNIIDSEIVLNRRWFRIPHRTRSYLERKGQSIACCQALELPHKLDIKCGENTDTYKKVISIVVDSHNKGEYTFNEMLLYAGEALYNNPYIAESIQQRFPILLIDEAQDTSAYQWDLLKHAFPEESKHTIRQGFGDSNQAIFNSFQRDESSTNFPRKNALTIANSKRFNEYIARLADNLTLMQPGMTGENTGFECLNDKHTIFLFDKKQIGAVATAFAKHLLNNFSDKELDDYRKYGCHVIGMVHTAYEAGTVDNAKFPKSVCDYWNLYNPSYSGRSANLQYLIEYFRLGRIAFMQTQNTDVLTDWISRGLRRYINMNSTVQIPATTDAFIAICRSLPENKQADFRRLFLSIIFADIDTKENWIETVAIIQSMVNELFGFSATWNDNLSWQPQQSIDPSEGNNIYNFIDEESGRSVQLTFGSIHSVKGRTHLATLIVETFWNNANMKSLIPWLCGTPLKKKVGVRDAMRMKCHYVALTRARGLVCLAIPIDSVDTAVREKLISNRWNIKEL